MKSLCLSLHTKTFLGSNSGSKLYDGEKYTMTEAQINAYTWQMNLTINELKKSDFGAYTCSSNNALGKSGDRVRLQGMMIRFGWR